MNTHERIKVLVCHGNPILQAGVAAMLARHPDLDCTAEEAGTPDFCFQAMPEVIVADRDGGIEWIGAINKNRYLRDRARVLVLTHSDRECDIRAALSAGVQGYLLIDDAPEHLAAAIRSVTPTGRILSPRVASRLAETMAGEPLTHREQAVLGFVIEGLCNKSIGIRLGIQLGTVKSHLRSAFSKLGAGSRTQAVAIAHRRGLLQQCRETLP